VKAVREGLALRLSNLPEKVKSTEKNVTELSKKLAQLHKGTHKSKQTLELGAAHTLRFKLHHKKRRLHLLRTKLARLEAEAARPVPRLTFGSNKLFRAQFHFKENGFANHQEWQAVWRAARSSQFVCVGSKDETAGNQSCTYPPATHSLRLRLPHALIPADGSSDGSLNNKYLNIDDVTFPYGDDVIRAALAAEGGQALTFRFIGRCEKSRTGKQLTGYEWYVQVTTERVAVPKTTDRRLGAIGIDLNLRLIAWLLLTALVIPLAPNTFPSGCTNAQVSNKWQRWSTW